LLKEFKEFVMRGNVLDMAVGIVIGIAFGGIVNSIVNDVIMPPIGLILGNVDFSNLFINLSAKSFSSLAEAKSAGAPVIAYGTFLNTVVNFLIVAFVLFVVIRVFNQFRRKEPTAAPTTKDCPYCFTEIPIQAIRCPHCTSELKTI
jgi:large conductance mechanosensitive channel